MVKSRRSGGPSSGQTSGDVELRVVMGIQPVRELVRVRATDVVRVFVERRAGPKVVALARFARDQGIEVTEAGRSDLDKLSKGVRHQGVVAQAPEIQLVPLEALLSDQARLLVLDGITDPQNFGALVRSSVALGGTGIVFPEHASASMTPATFRASAGAIEHARLCRVSSLPRTLEQLNERGFCTVALDKGGPAQLHELNLTGPVAVVIGAEDRGPRSSLRRLCSHTARLPMTPAIDSLNASVAGALALYEVARQAATTTS